MATPKQRPASEWHEDEFVFTPTLVNKTVPRNAHCVKFNLPRNLPFRKIYCYVEPVFPSVAHFDYFMLGELSLWNENTIIERIPASRGQDIAQNLLTRKSIYGIAWLMNSKTDNAYAYASAGDCIEVCTATKFQAGFEDRVILAPHKVVSYCDQISYSLLEAKADATNVVGYRIFVAVQSLNYAY